MGLFSFLERQAGDGKFAKNLIDTYHRGQARTSYGRGVMDQGLSGLDDLDSQLSGQLAKGGLSDDLLATFDRGRGAITDEAQRARLGYQSLAEQMLRRSGGSLDPSQALDMGVENDANIQGNTFTARNNLADSEAKLRMDNTNALLDKIFAIRDRKLGAGQAEEQSGVNQQLSALQLRYQRQQAIWADVMQGVGMGKSAGGAPTGYHG